MARYRGSVCRICRREQTKLFLKGERCLSDKCSFEKRAYPPGQHGRRRPKITDYGMMLREKQKVKRMYGILEKQFKNYFKKAVRIPGVTGYNLLLLLERRLDNIVYRLGFAVSRRQARQLVTHGHFMVDGKPVNIPSYQVSINEVIKVREKSRNLLPIKLAIEASKHGAMPSWLVVDYDKMEGYIKEYPAREDIPVECQEQLIVELYSK